MSAHLLLSPTKNIDFWRSISCVKSVSNQSLLLEPVGRNTAPALTLATLAAVEHGDNPVPGSDTRRASCGRHFGLRGHNA